MKNFPWQILLDWFDKNGKHTFPWRQYDHTDGIGYRIWLAEILLQQTQADRVVPFYEKILSTYPTIHMLANASYDEFFPLYQGLGYYSRARNLLKTAKIVSEEYNGIFPRDKKLLRKLPGIGEYTARAILAFGYTEPALAWDTNLETIFSRYYKGSKAIKLTESEKEKIEEDFRDFIEKNTHDIQSTGRVPILACEFGIEKKRSEFDGVWGEKLFELDESSGEIEQSDSSFSLPNSFGTFSKKSTGETVGKKEDLIRNINNALMDWARLMEPKNSNLLDRESYIFTESEFYRTGGTEEIIEKKTSAYFPIPDAQVIVILHQDHKIYYSLSNERYSPFVLPPSLHRDTRKYVQDYFRDTYSIELSVRPVHKKWITEDGNPYIAVNAQIQAGTPDFNTFSKSEIKKMESFF